MFDRRLVGLSAAVIVSSLATMSLVAVPVHAELY